MPFYSAVSILLACQGLVGGRQIINIQQKQAWTKNRVLRYTRVYRGRLRIWLITGDNNRLLPVSKEINPGVDFSCDAVAVEFVRVVEEV